jgi:enterochelin esterase-like enzyme
MHLSRTRIRWGLSILVVVLVGTAVWWFTTPHLHPDRYGIKVERFTFDSPAVGEELDEIALLPPGDLDGKPVLLFLHGRGSSPESVLSDELFAALRSQGDGAPVVVLADGGDASYFHDRRTGAWGSYLLEELVPEVGARWDVDTDRLAIGGISMGGFGALDQARLNPARFCAVGGHSPAIFETGADTTEGSFDDAEDFDRHDVYGAVKEEPDLYGTLPIWIDVGDKDPFRSTDESLAERLEAAGADIEFRVSPGGHNESYWWEHMGEYMDFYLRALRDC